MNNPTNDLPEEERTEGILTGRAPRDDDMKLDVQADRQQPEVFKCDLHGLHPDELYGEDLEDVIRTAHAAGAREVVFIHGHGFNRRSTIRTFTNSNTGYLGQTTRKILRLLLQPGSDVREIALVKIDTSDIGATSVFLRQRKNL